MVVGRKKVDVTGKGGFIKRMSRINEIFITGGFTRNGRQYGREGCFKDSRIEIRGLEEQKGFGWEA